MGEIAELLSEMKVKAIVRVFGPNRSKTIFSFEKGVGDGVVAEAGGGGEAGGASTDDDDLRLLHLWGVEEAFWIERRE